MYHSVSGPACPAVAGAFPIPMDRFIAQVDGLRERGWAVGKTSEIHEPVGRNTVYLTSDDGTVDWARNVLPWCEEQGLPTHTALISGVWDPVPTYPIAHLVQVLLACRPPERLPMPTLTPEQRAYIDTIYAYETAPGRRYLKGACNVLFDFEQATAFLGLPDFDTLRSLVGRFAEPEAYNRFQHAEVGVHTARHLAYDGDAAGYLEREIYPCLVTLLRRCERVTRVFTLPVKPREGVSLEPLNKLLAEQGFTGMYHNPGEWSQRDFIIPRIDAKNVETFFGLPEWKN